MEDVKSRCQALKTGCCEEWDLSGIVNGDEDMRLVEQVAKGCDFLRVLRLVDCKLGDSGAAGVQTILRTCENIRFLDLSHNRIGDEGAEFLSEGLWVTKSLEHVNLSHNPAITEEGTDHFRFALRKNWRPEVVVWEGNSTDLLSGLVRGKRPATPPPPPEENPKKKFVINKKLGTVSYHFGGKVWKAAHNEDGALVLELNGVKEVFSHAEDMVAAIEGKRDLEPPFSPQPKVESNSSLQPRQPSVQVDVSAEIAELMRRVQSFSVDSSAAAQGQGSWNINLDEEEEATENIIRPVREFSIKVPMQEESPAQGEDEGWAADWS